MDLPFEIVPTQDGSWSLRPHDTEGEGQRGGEAMHSLLGAWSETLYIYEPVVKLVLAAGAPQNFISMGLGLGYNEILAAAHLQQGPMLPDANLISFESVPFLRESLTSFLFAWSESDLDEIYRDLMHRGSLRTLTQPAALQNFCKDLLSKKIWQLEGALETPEQISDKWTGIFYDAYSSKTTPHLWNEDFLFQVLTRSNEPVRVFSTYACTGSLKRALQRAGFETIIRTGFGGKRECTMGVFGLKRSLIERIVPGLRHLESAE